MSHPELLKRMFSTEPLSASMAILTEKPLFPWLKCHIKQGKQKRIDQRGCSLYSPRVCFLWVPISQYHSLEKVVLWPVSRSSLSLLDALNARNQRARE